MNALALSAADVKVDFRVRRGEIVRALRGVSIDVPFGSMTGIKGPSGSGKSTLLYCLAGLEQATAVQCEHVNRHVIRAPGAK
ncbi:MAG: ATP-binding cassette domain-containing protein [Bifidobacteriaceae bacterium]|nr:ATP-binding cassette domain-containing protein [Bifidobacteriaceae bacterium]